MRLPTRSRKRRVTASARSSCSRLGSSCVAVQPAPSRSTACWRARRTRRPCARPSPMISLDVVDVEPMQHHVQHHRVAVRRLISAATRALELEGARAARGSRSSRRVLSWNDSWMWSSPACLQRLDARLGQADARGDEVGVEAERVRLGDELLQVVAHQRLAARTGRAAPRPARAPRAARASSPRWPAPRRCWRSRSGCSRTRSAAGSGR